MTSNEDKNAPPETAADPAALPRVGMPTGDLPGQDATAGVEEQADKSTRSRWWGDPTKPDAAPSPRSESSGARRGWTTSAGEEMEKFRRLPVLGRLPWRLQYAIALGVLAVSLAVLIVLSVQQAHQAELVARGASADLVMRQTLQSIGAMRQSATGAADGTRLPILINQGSQAIEQLSGLSIPGQAGAITDLKAQWKVLNDAVSSQANLATTAQNVALAASDLHGQLGDLLPRMTAVTQQIGGATPGLAQVMADLADWQDLTLQIANQGAAIPDRLILERQRIEQLLRAFAKQPDHAQSPELGAWQALATAWPTLQPRLDAVLVQREAWASARGGTQSLGEKMDSVSQTLNGLTATSMAWQANQSGLRSASWLVGALAGLALALFMLVAWKQQRFRVVETLAHQEQTERALLEFVEDIREIASGNLTRRPRGSATSVGVVAEALGKALEVLRRLIGRVKKSVEKASEASTRATAATVALVDDARTGAAAAAAQAPLVHALTGRSHELVAVAGTLTGKAQAVAETAGTAAGDADAVRDAFQSSRSAVEEARARADRLASGSEDHNRALATLSDLAEEAKVLSVQTSIQAAKLGERGQGLQRVSDGISQLAARLEPIASKTITQARSLQSDAEGVARQLDAAASSLNDGLRRADALRTAVGEVNAQTSALSHEAGDLVERVQAQDDTARQLDALVKQDTARVALAPQEAEGAALAVSELIQAAQDLGTSVERFRV